MATWVIPNARRPALDCVLRKELKLIVPDILIMDESQCISKLDDTLLSDGANPLTLVLDVHCIQLISYLIDLLSRLFSNRIIPLKIVLLSSVTTWGRTSSRTPITDVDAAFALRVPLESAQDLYVLENQIVRLSTRYKLDCTIIAVGLIYGRSGMDLRDTFRFIWRNDSAVSPLKFLCDEDSHVPLIHCDALLSMVCSAMEWSKRETSVILAVEEMEKSFVEMLTCADQTLNEHSASNFECAKPESVIEAVSDNSDCGVWLCNIQTQTNHSLFKEGTINFEGSLSKIWSEFTATDGLKPFTMILAGAPSVGKSEIARLLSERVNVQLVNAVTAASFVLHLEVDERNEEGSNDPLSNTCHSAKEALITAIRAKMNEGGKKGAKGAPAVAEDAPLDESILTASFCRTLPGSTALDCIALQLRLDSVCARRGYILDIWDDQFVYDAQSLQKILSLLGEKSEPGEKITDSDRVAQVDLSSVGSKQKIDLILELQCTSTWPVERLTSALGAQVKAKESQAQIKALEALVAAYTAKIKPLEESSTEGTPPSPDYCSHEGVIEISSQLAHQVHRVMTSDDNFQAVVDDVFAKICSQFSVGWVKSGNEMEEIFDNSQKEINEGRNEGDTPIPSGDICPSDIKKTQAGEKKSLVGEFNELDAQKAQKLKLKADKLQSFLTATVMSQVTEGMIMIIRDQPADPIRFLSQHLAKHSATNYTTAEDAAKVEFQQLLQGH